VRSSRWALPRITVLFHYNSQGVSSTEPVFLNGRPPVSVVAQRPVNDVTVEVVEEQSAVVTLEDVSMTH